MIQNPPDLRALGDECAGSGEAAWAADTSLGRASLMVDVSACAVADCTGAASATAAAPSGKFGASTPK